MGSSIGLSADPSDRQQKCITVSLPQSPSGRTPLASLSFFVSSSSHLIDPSSKPIIHWELRTQSSEDEKRIFQVATSAKKILQVWRSSTETHSTIKVNDIDALAQLFDGRLALTRGQVLIPISFLILKAFSRTIFSFCQSIQSSNCRQQQGLNSICFLSFNIRIQISH